MSFNYNIASSKYILRDLETSLGEVSVYFHIKSAVGKTEKARKLSVEWVPTVCDEDTYNKIAEVYPDDIDHHTVEDVWVVIYWKPSEISKSEINEDPSCSITFDEDGNVVEGEEEEEAEYVEGEEEGDEAQEEVKEEPAKKKGGRPKKSEEEKEAAKKAKEEAKAEKEAEKARKKAEKASKKKTSDKKKKVEPEPEDENVEDEDE